MAEKEFMENVILAGLNASFYDSTATTPAWVNIPNITNVGALGETADKKEKTNLGSEIKEYGEGMLDAPDKAIQGQYIPPQASTSKYYADWERQQRFIKLCRAKQEMMFRITWKDGEVNSFLFKPLDFQFDEPDQEEWKMFTINGSQNTRMLWAVELEAETASTVAVSGTINILAATDPEDLDIDETEAFTWSSSDETVATVDENGTVTGVAAGTATISAMIRGVTGTIDVTVTA